MNGEYLSEEYLKLLKTINITDEAEEEEINKEIYDYFLNKINYFLTSKKLPTVKYFHIMRNDELDLAANDFTFYLKNGVYLYVTEDTKFEEYQDKNNIDTILSVENELLQNENNEIINYYNIKVEKGNEIKILKLDHSDLKILHQIISRYVYKNDFHYYGIYPEYYY